MFTVATESELAKVVAMLVTASVPDDRDNENAWTPICCRDGKAVSATAQAIRQWRARAESRLKLRIDPPSEDL